MLKLAYVAFIVIAGVPTFPITDTDRPFADINDCWEAVDHGLETGDIKLGDGVKAVCLPYLDDNKP